MDAATISCHVTHQDNKQLTIHVNSLYSMVLWFVRNAQLVSGFGFAMHSGTKKYKWMGWQTQLLNNCMLLILKLLTRSQVCKVRKTFDMVLSKRWLGQIVPKGELKM